MVKLCKIKRLSHYRLLPAFPVNHRPLATSRKTAYFLCMNSPEKNPVGRPTKYRPEYCDELILDGMSGYSLTAFAGLIGVARSTINEWMGEFPEFSEAVKKHQAVRTRFLEGGLMAAPDGPKVTSRIFALKNADPDGWRDKVIQEHTGGIAVTISQTDAEL